MYDIDELLDEKGKEISVGDLRDLCEHIGMDQPDSKNMRKINNNSYSIEIDTPDGWVELTHFVYKGKLPMVRIETTLGYITTCATNHLIQSIDESWIPASNVQKGTPILVDNGTMDIVTTIQNIPEEECYDFTVNHSNHRYWGDGISSHNSGKSYLVSGNAVKDAQKQGIFVVLIDTENALDETWLHALGVDTSPEKLLKINAAMIDDVAKIISDFVSTYRSDYGSLPSEERPKVLFVIDSLGMLMTPTDVAHFEKGDLKGDMGRKPKALKALVTNCVNMFGDLDIALIATNHTYASQD